MNILQRIGAYWTTLIGILSFGILVPTFFIPMELWTVDHLQICIVAISLTFWIWEGAKYIQRMTIKYFPWEKSIVRHLLFEILYIFVYTTFLLTAGLLIYDKLISSLNITFVVVARNVFVAFLLALLFTAINEGKFLFSQWKKSLLEQERLKEENLLARLEGLKKQLDPHFLFNSLSVLSGLVYKDPLLADTFITKLSKVYRYVLEQKETNLVRLEDEIKFIDAYYFLMKVRFNKALELNKQISTRPNQWIPPLALQLLIENAIKHNKTLDFDPLEINIYTENNYIWIKNKKNLRPIGKKSTQVGLKNLVSRFNYITDKEVIIKNNKKEYIVGLPLIQKN